MNEPTIRPSTYLAPSSSAGTNQRLFALSLYFIIGLKELAAATKSSPMYAASSISSNSNNKKLNLELRS